MYRLPNAGKYMLYLPSARKKIHYVPSAGHYMQCLPSVCQTKTSTQRQTLESIRIQYQTWENICTVCRVRENMCPTCRPRETICIVCQARENVSTVFQKKTYAPSSSQCPIAGKHLNPVPKLPKRGKTFALGTMCGKACMRSYKMWKNTNGAKLAGQKFLTQASGLKPRKSYDQRQLCRKMLVPDWFLKWIRGSVHEPCIMYTLRKISG